MTLKSQVLETIPGIEHGFGTRDESIPPLFLKNWNSRPHWKQVHGISISTVEQPNQECGQVDGLTTRKPQIPIGIVTADCVPILMAHRSGKVVAAVHAGWKGTLNRITEALWHQLKTQGESPSDWVASIGPSIGPCCYEVSEDLISIFTKEFSEIEPRLLNPRFRILNLQAIHQATLERLGLQQVEVMQICTHCSTQPSFHSYRRDKGTERQYSLISINST